MDQLPPPCANGCGRPVRPRGTTAADYPVTRTWYAKARGMCERCYQATEGKGRNVRPDNCVECKRPLRGAKSTSKEFPGTVRHWGNGICCTCKKGAKTQKRKPPTECVRCEHPMRPRGTRLEDHPGTKQHDCNGLCTGCRAAVRRRAAVLGDPGATPTPVVAYKPRPKREDLSGVTDPVALRIRAERKTRLEKQERAKQLRIQQERVRAQFLARRAA